MVTKWGWFNSLHSLIHRVLVADVLVSQKTEAKVSLVFEERQYCRDLQAFAIESVTGFLPHLVEEFEATVIPPEVWLDASGSHDLTAGRLRLSGGVKVGERNVRSSSHYEGGVELMSVELAPSVVPVDYLAGRWLYFGLAVEHFGHFLMESLGRAWALDEPDLGEINGIILLIHPEISNELSHLNSELLKIMTGLPVCFITVPTLVECILIPRQESLSGIGILSTPRQIKSLRLRFQSGPRGLDEVVYISRAGITGISTGRILGSEELEKRMRSCGVRVVRPETLSVAEQLKIYRGARVIVAEESSALHLAAVAASSEVQVIVIARRPWMKLIFDAHLTLFLGSGASIHMIEPPGVRLTLPEERLRVWLSLDAPELQRKLEAIDPIFSSPLWAPIDKRVVRFDMLEVSEVFGDGVRKLEPFSY